MRVLAIETSSDMSSIALRDGERLEGERAFESRMRLNQRLAPQLRQLAGGERMSAAGLDLIAVGIGPGSFTGVRMGVALAKALAHALELPLVGVSAPEAIAAGLELPPGSAVAVLQTARAEEVYATALTVGADGVPEELAPTRAQVLSEALRTVEELPGRAPDVVAGSATGQFAGRIREALPEAQIAGEEHALSTAAQVARVAVARADSADPQAAFALTPRYVRLSQAERQFGVDLGLSG